MRLIVDIQEILLTLEINCCYIAWLANFWARPEPQTSLNSFSIASAKSRNWRKFVEKTPWKLFRQRQKSYSKKKWRLIALEKTKFSLLSKQLCKYNKEFKTRILSCLLRSVLEVYFHHGKLLSLFYDDGDESQLQVDATFFQSLEV